MTVSNSDSLVKPAFEHGIDASLYGDSYLVAGDPKSLTDADRAFIKGLYNVQSKQYTTALSQFDAAVNAEGTGKYSEYYKAFYHLNRGVLRAGMIDFISSIENNVQTLTMDDKGTTRARVRDQVSRTYDYSEAIDDMLATDRILPGVPYVYFNLGNLYCLSSEIRRVCGQLHKNLINIYPYMGDAYYNKWQCDLMKDKEKGCIDLSRAVSLVSVMPTV